MPDSSVYPTLDRSPKKNWVDNAGGLPDYIERIAKHLHYEKGKPIGTAIAIAVNVVKKMCSTGDINFPGIQHVNEGSHAEACAAVADWERKKAQARVTKGIKGRRMTDKEYIDMVVKRDFTMMQREKLAGKKEAMPGGGFPIANRQDLRNAIQAIGRAKNPEATKKFIMRRAKELGCENMIPSNWISKSMSDDEFDEILEAFGDEENFVLTGEIEKFDEGKQLVFGWASVAKLPNGEVVVDKQGDVLDDIDAMEDVAYDFVLHSRDGGEMHVRKGVSTLVESFVSTPEKRQAMGIPEGILPDGWWVGFKVADQEVWKAAREGRYKMFSVHGTGVRKEMSED